MPGTATTGRFREKTPATRNRESGLGLIELMIVVAIFGLLAYILSDSYGAWSRKYRVETEVKEFYADLMEARARAMQRNRAHFVELYGPASGYTRYALYEDNSPRPDGDGTLVNTADAKIREISPRYPVVATPAGTTLIRISRDGTVDMDATFRISAPDVPSADYDCIVVGMTRIKMGRYEGATCVAK